MPAGLDHLLRTLAAVPPTTRVLCLGDASGEAASLLARLGFEVHTSPTPEAFGWAAVWADGPEPLAGLGGALVPGGWAWIALATETAAPEALTEMASGAGLALAEAPAEAHGPAGRVVRGIYRRGGAGVTG